MKTLNNYITEKFKLNSKTIEKFNLEKFSKDILLNFGFDPEENDKYSIDILKIIKSWVNDNNIKSVKYYADEECKNEYENNLGLDLNNFSTDDDKVSDCNDELTKSDTLYKIKERGEYIEFFGNEKQIAVSNDYGTLFCVKN